MLLDINKEGEVDLNKSGDQEIGFGLINTTAIDELSIGEIREIQAAASSNI